jgi:hypothetical protein
MLPDHPPVTKVTLGIDGLFPFFLNFFQKRCTMLKLYDYFLIPFDERHTQAGPDDCWIIGGACKNFFHPGRKMT